MKVYFTTHATTTDAVDTVKIAFGTQILVIVDKRLRELNYGDFNGKPSEICLKN